MGSSRGPSRRGWDTDGAHGRLPRPGWSKDTLLQVGSEAGESVAFREGHLISAGASVDWSQFKGVARRAQGYLLGLANCPPHLAGSVSCPTTLGVQCLLPLIS